MGPYYQVARGLRKASAIITTVGAGHANALIIYTPMAVPPATVIRTVIVRKIMCYSNVGAGIMELGLGAAFAGGALFPIFNVIANFDTEWTEDELPEVEIGQPIYVATTPLGIITQIEVEVIGP